MRNKTVLLLIFLLSGCNAELVGQATKSNEPSSSRTDTQPETPSPTFISISPQFGPEAGGGTVTITGTSFQSNTTLSLGNNACSHIVVQSSQSITCTVPAGTPGLTSITLTNANISPVVVQNAYSYTSNPLPIVLSVSPTQVSVITRNQTITISGSGFGNINNQGTLLTPTVFIEQSGVFSLACSNVQQANSNTLSCVLPLLPSSNSSYTVKVKNPDLQSGALSNAIQFTPSGAPTYTQLKTAIFNSKCFSCHSGGSPTAGLGFDNFSSVQARIAANHFADQSTLFIRAANGSMPPGGPALSAQETTDIQNWISAGAQNN